MTWGHTPVDADEEAQEWPRFQTAVDTPITVSGDPDWGKAVISDGTPGRSNVLNLGDSNARTFTIIQNKYGTGDEGNAYIRGSATSFAQHDGTPSWELYSTPIVRNWQYVQISIVNE